MERPIHMIPKWALFICTICVFWAVEAQSSSQAYDPGLYVYWNDVIVEGVLLYDVEVPPENGLEARPGWRFPTNRACVLVHSILWCESGPTVAEGDTLCFLHKTSNVATNPDEPGQGLHVLAGDHSLSLEVGEQGLFSFNRSNTGSLKRGTWFSLPKEKKAEVQEFINNLNSDFVGTVKDLKFRHPTVRINWEPDGPQE
jgi:hypothetical protein